MTWNHRVIRQKATPQEAAVSGEEYVYSIREVFYDEEGHVDLWSNAIEMYFEDDKIDMLIYLMEAFMKPTLEEKDGHLFYEKAKPASGDQVPAGFSIRAAEADE